MDDITMQQEQALQIARLLVKAGVPLFLAHPNPAKRHGFDLPFAWEQAEADPAIIEQWRPGMALCAVTGHTFDLIDIDPRSGGSETDLGAAMPHSYLTAETPSGGRHHFVRTLGVPSLDGKVAQGIDVKSGTLEGSGRGFAFIAPTVRTSKVDGVPREYRWVLGPKGPALPTPDQLAGDGSGALLRARVLEIRRSSSSATPRRIAASQAHREWTSALASLTANVAHWQRHGWGGEAHSSILAATTHLARLSPEHAEAAFVGAFAAAGAVPDSDDMQKLHSAIERAVPDVVVPDHELSPVESFFLGGAAPALPGASLPAPAAPWPAGVTPGAPGAEFMIGGAPGAHPGRAGEIDSVGRRRFQPMSRAEAAAIVAPDPLVDGLLFTSSKGRLSGPSGTGKTWVVLDLAAHVAAGMPWQGRAVRQSRVLYVAGEGAPTFDRRMAAWEEKHQRAAEVDIVPEAVQLGADDLGYFAQEIAAANYGLIVFDTQGSMTVGLEENSSKDANIVLSRLDLLRQMTNACLLLVHHTGWDDKGRPRGSSAMYGGMDTELILSGTTGDLKLTIDKQKYVEKDKPLRLALEKVGGGLALTTPGGGLQSAGGFFGGAHQAEHAAKVAAVVARIDDYYAAGGTSKLTARALIQVLRTELNVSAKNEVLREAAQRYIARAGMPVDLESYDA